MPSDRPALIEIFGPTVQGEGPDAGVPAHFVRLGGCDFRCEWCDSLHAVEPEFVRQAERVTGRELVRRVAALPAGPRLVVLTGGNPALYDLAEPVALLHELGYRVAVETQGSVWRPWLLDVDRLVISPKPPSAGRRAGHRVGALMFLDAAQALADRGRGALKIVVFDRADLEYAIALRERAPDWPLYLSAGTPVGLGEEETRAAVAERYGWLAEQASRRRELHAAVVLPQLHVIAWGTRRGV